MTLLALVSTLLAALLAAIAWMQRREAQARSAARVAALAASIDGPLDAFSAEGASGGAVPAAMPARRAGMIAVGALPLVLVAATLLVARAPRSAPAASVRQPESLELLDMRHDRAGDRLTITGTVRVRGNHTAPVTAVVIGRDTAGRVVSTSRAPLDDASLDVDGESSFRVSVAGAQDVRRYQVRFETPLGPLTHIDRRHMP